MQVTAGPTAATPAELAAELLSLWHHLLKGGVKGVYALLDELDLGFTHVKTLHTLADLGTEVSVKQLAEHMGMSLPGASRVADALHHRGYVDRHEDPNDRRARRLCITAAGLRVVERIDSARLRSLQDFTASLAQEQRDALHAALLALPHPRPGSPA